MANPSIQIIIEAIQKGFPEVIAELQKLENTFKGISNTIPVTSVQQLSQKVDVLSTQLTKATASMENFTKSAKRGTLGILDMQWTVKSFIMDMERMIAIQLRWYAARAIVNPALAVLAIPATAAKVGFDFMKEVDAAEATIARYGAMEGQTRDQYRATAKEIVEQSRQIALNMPIAFEEVIKVADRLRAAGIELDVIKGSLTTFAKLQITFPEIDAEKFTTAIVGFLNTFRTTPGLRELENDSERFKLILDKVTMALSIGVIAPKDIGVLIQHLGQMSQAAGFSIDQMLALSVVITNLGSKAGSAGRLLSGWLSGMGTDKFQKQMEELGYTMDRDLSIAEQFPKIIKTIQDAIGTGKGAGLTFGGFEEISKMTSSQRQRIVVAIGREMEMYQEYVKQIEGSTGALERAYGPVANTIKSALTELKNAALEAAYAFLQIAGDAESAKTIIDSLTWSLKALAFTLVAVGSAVQFVAAPFVFVGRTLIAVGKAVYEFSEAWIQLREAMDKGNYGEGLTRFANKTKLALADLRVDLTDAAEKMADSMSLSKATERHTKAYNLLFGSPERESEREGWAPEGHPQSHETAPERVTPDKKVKTREAGSIRTLIDDERRRFALAIQNIKDEEATAIRSLETRHAFGLVSENAYWKQRSDIYDKAFEDEEAAQIQHIANINVLYDRLVKATKQQQKDAKVKDPTAVTAVEDKRKTDIEAAETKLNTLRRQNNDRRERDTVASLQREQQQVANHTRALMNIWALYYRGALRIQETYYEMHRAAVEFSYSLGAITASAAYDKELELLKNSTEDKIALIEKEAERRKQLINQELAVPGAPARTANLERELATTEAAASDAVVNAKLDEVKRKFELDAKYLKDAQYLYERYYKGSFTDTFRHHLTVTLNEYQKWGEQLKKIAETTAQAMSDTFSSLFFDIYEGKVKSAWEYTKQFADAVLKQIFNAVSQQLTAVILSPLKIGLPGLSTPTEELENLNTQLMNITADTVYLMGEIQSNFLGNEEEGWAPLGHPQSHEEVAEIAEIGGEEGLDIVSQFTEGSSIVEEDIVDALTTGSEEGGKTLVDALSSAWGMGADLLTGAVSGLMGMFSGGGGGEGGLGLAELAMSFFAHSGKRAGEVSTGMVGLVPAAAFSGAPRFHTGKGIAQDEMAAIIKKDEWVFPDSKVMKGAAGGGNSMTISVPLTIYGDSDFAKGLPRKIEQFVREEIKKRS